MKALKDFSHMGIEVKAGEEVSNDLFEPDVYPMLVMKGLVGEVSEPAPVEPKRSTAAKRQRKDK